MKKSITFILAAAMVICMTACSSTENDSASDKSTDRTELTELYAPAEAAGISEDYDGSASKTRFVFEYSKISRSADGLYELIGTVEQDGNKTTKSNIQLIYRGDGSVLMYSIYSPDGTIETVYEPVRTIEKQTELLMGIDKVDGSNVYMDNGFKNVIETDKDGLMKKTTVYNNAGDKVGEMIFDDHHMISKRVFGDNELSISYKNIVISDLIK